MLPCVKQRPGTAGGSSAVPRQLLPLFIALRNAERSVLSTLAQIFPGISARMRKDEPRPYPEEMKMHESSAFNKGDA